MIYKRRPSQPSAINKKPEDKPSVKIKRKTKKGKNENA